MESLKDSEAASGTSKHSESELSIMLGVCQEAIAVLSSKPSDEQLLTLIGAQLCYKLKEMVQLLQGPMFNYSSIFDDQSLASNLWSAVSAFYDLHKVYFLDLGTGLVSPIVHSLLLTLNVLATLAENCQQVQTYLVNGGHLFQNFFELEELKKTLSGDKVALNFMSMNLMILYSSSKQSGFHRYFRHLDPGSFWNPLCKSTQFVIRYHSMVIAGRIYPHIPSMGTEILQLTDSDVEIVIDLLAKASSSDKHEVCGHQCIFSTMELLLGINCFLCDATNATKMVKRDILTTLFSVLVAGLPDEQEQSILVLWNLSHHLSLMENVQRLDLPLIDILQELNCTSENSGIKLAASGLLSSIDPTNSKPHPEACYSYCNYEQCITQCDTICSTEGNFGFPIESVISYKAKSLFKLFKYQQSILNRSVLDEKNFRMEHDFTFSKAKNALLVLDKAVLDAESSQMFDLAMMEYASATNCLNEIQRCLLCRARAKLLRSHICPHSILREYCLGASVPENLRVFDTDFAKIGHCKSAKEATMFAFCKSCEHLLSVNGEQDFINNFFRKIYSKSDLSVQSKGLNIEYGSWLYQFCIGMLFRALMKQKLDKYNNLEEMYDFFLKCRQILLDPSLQSQVVPDLPDLYILIGPHKARNEDKEYGFVNQVLNDAYFSLVWDSHSPPYTAHFLLVHIGIIYIIKIFSSSEIELPAECKVDPKSNMYVVPSEEDRNRLFTEKWWNVIREVALSRSKGWLERPLAPLKRLQEKKEKMVHPAPLMDNLFHVYSSTYADLEVFEQSIVPSHPDRPRIVSLLPPGFKFRPPIDMVIPNEHRILFHHSINDKECYFVAVGGGSLFGFDKPYVIYSHCEPGLQVSLGFFIDPETLKFVDFLPSREGKAMLERLAVVDQLKGEVHSTIAKCLKAKGIDCLSDIFHLLELDTTRFIFDTKCFAKYCWYCVNKCCLCLKPAGSDYSSITSTGKILKYCSLECQKGLNETSSLKLNVTKPGDNFEPRIKTSQDVVKVGISGSGMLSNAPNIPAIFKATFLMYVRKVVEKEQELFLVSLFHSTRSNHMQTFIWYKDFSSVSEMLAALKGNTSGHEHLKCIISLLLNSFPETESEMSSNNFYNNLCGLTQPITLGPASYLCFPLLEVSILDTQKIKSVPLCKASEPDSPQVVRAMCVTEYQFFYLQEIMPPDCAIPVKFVNEVREVRSDDGEFDKAFSNAVKDICVVLASWINSLPMPDGTEGNEEFYENLTQLNVKVERGLERLPTLLKIAVADNFTEMTFFTKNLKTVISTLYTGLNRGLSGVASKCLLSTLSLVGLCCFYSSSLRDFILSQTDVLTQLSCQLQELKYIEQVDQFIISLTTASLNAIRGLCMDSRYYWQFMEESIPETIASYSDSPLTGVAIAAKVSISSLACILEPKLMEQISVTELMVDKLNEIQISDFNILVPKEFQNLLNILMYISSLMNSSVIISSLTSKPKLLSVILRIMSSTFQLSNDYELEKEVALSLAFKLALQNKSVFGDQEETMAQILSLSGSQSSNLQAMASCVLWKLGDEVITDLPSDYVSVCYEMKCFAESLLKCEEMLKSDPNVSSDVNNYMLLMKAKSLFQIFVDEIVVLKRQKGQVQEKFYRLQHSDCYAKVKQCIFALGTLLDKGELNAEGSQLLDLSMIHYAYETNDLRSCKRCLLCRKVAKLQRSHIWPRALLQELSSGVEVPDTKKSYLVSWQPQNRFWSPKEITFFLFCESCEHLLNQFGESQFIPHFFRKVHNSLCPDQEIVYGPWLYQFCIGIIFRGLLNPALMKFVNGGETYSLLESCRTFLLTISDSSSLNDDNSLPQVYIFLNQVGSDTVSKDSINHLLKLRTFFGVEEIDLSDGKITKPRSAQYFLAHFGTVNILTKFKASTYKLHPTCKISSSGGSFNVPANSQRQHLIPPGVWTVLLSLTDFQVNRYMEGQDPGGLQQISKENIDLLGLLSSGERDLSSMLLQIQLFASSPKMISFLPREFIVRHSGIELPHQHRVLLHYLINHKDSSQDTLFLCAGTGGNYSLKRLYVIYHYFKGGFELAAAFFISSDDLTAQEFLPESQDLPTLNKISQVSSIRQYIHKLLPTILQEKGFLSFRSLSCRIHESNSGSVDMRCQSPSRCWYCLDRCDFCMRPVPFGCTRKVIQTFSTQFCASCQDIAREKGSVEAKVSRVNPENLPLPLAISPLSLSHLPLIHARCSATIAGKPFIYEFVLCEGKGSEDLPMSAPYVIYHHWHLFTQQFLEFTVTPDMSLAEPVVYTEGEGSISAVTQLRGMPIQSILLQALQTYEIAL